MADAETIRDALLAGLALLDAVGKPTRAQWPAFEGLSGAGIVDTAQEEELTDERRWRAGVHAGLRRVAQGQLALAALAPGGGETP
jgi:CRISPR system Cascade subunit CasD